MQNIVMICILKYEMEQNKTWIMMENEPLVHYG